MALVHSETQAIYLAMENFGGTVTSFVLDEEEDSWPFVAIPHFEKRGDLNNKLSMALMLVMSPIVPLLEREAWEDYATTNQGWIQDGLSSDPKKDYHNGRMEAMSAPGYELENISYPIWHYGLNGEHVPDKGRGPYLPVWQMAPAPYNSSIVNYNLLDNPVFEKNFRGMERTDLPVLSEVTDLTFLYGGAVHDDATHPHCFLMYPIHENFEEVLSNDDNTNPLTGSLTAILAWDRFFVDLLPEEVYGMVIVVKDTCGDVFTYQVDGAQATFLGEGDLHNPKYNDMVEVTDFIPWVAHNMSDTSVHCKYYLHMYPSEPLHDKFLSSEPWVYTAVVVMVFALTTLTFVLYDFFVQRRNETVVLKAKRSNAIVSALFPKNVRDRIMKEAEEQVEAEMAMAKGGKRRFGIAQKTQLKSFLNEGAHTEKDQAAAGVAFAGKPIADLFPSATVMFADIAGFTAWSRYVMYCIIGFFCMYYPRARLTNPPLLSRYLVFESRSKSSPFWRPSTLPLTKLLGEGVFLRSKPLAIVM